VNTQLIETLAFISEGLNADAYFHNHRTASVGTVAKFLGGIEVQEVIDYLVVSSINAGAYDVRGFFCESPKNKAAKLVEVHGKHPRVTARGYEAIARRHMQRKTGVGFVMFPA
jgi:hypothetical protein